MSDLKPCPFCGGEAKMTKINYATWVECSNYHYEHHQVSVHAKTEAEAIAAWNTRAERTCKLTYKRGAMYDVARYSCCGYEYPESISEESVAENYCPNCGAKVVDA